MADEARRNRAVASWPKAGKTAASARLAANAAETVFMVAPPAGRTTPAAGYSGRSTVGRLFRPTMVRGLFRSLDVERKRARGQVVVAQAAMHRLRQRLRRLRVGVLLRPARAVRHLEDLDGRHSRRGFKKAAVRFGGHAEERPQPLAVQHHGVAEHVR